MRENSRTILAVFVFCIMFLAAEGSIKFWLTRSGLTTQILKNGSPVNASYFNSTQTYALDPLSQANLIWLGPGNNIGCDMSIRIVDSFQIKCPDHKLKLWIEADSEFNFTMTAPGFLTMTGSGNKKGQEKKFQYDRPWTCGLVFSLTIDVRNLYQSGSVRCKNNPAYVAYTAAVADCFCDDFPGTYWSWSTCQCAPCLQAIAGCIACNSPTNVSIVCTTCLTQKGWVLNNGTCVCPGSPVIGCLQCLDPGEACLHCNTALHFVLTSTGTCKCTSGYALVGTNCVTCSSVLSNCVTCSSSTTCLTCSTTSYAISAGNCVTCGTILSNCLTCSSNTTCISCVNTSYALTAGSCSACSAFMVGCTTCSAINNCLSCNLAQNFKRSGSLCICNSGYVLSGSTCVTCSSFMTGCSSCTSSTVCTTCKTANNFVLSGTQCVCKAGYTLVGTTCTLCSSLINNCLACSSSTTCTSCPTAQFMEVTAGSCTCVSGYYNSSNTCLSCSSALSNCVTCTSSSTCTGCIANYVVSSGSCVSCILLHPQCQTCTPTACTGCDATQNFVASAGTCTCITPTSVASGPTCVSCSTQTGCLECSNLLDCDVCAPGYYRDMFLDCQPCMSGCDVCVDSTTCTTCNIHYAWDGTSCVTCGTVLTGCYQCTSLSTCTACDSAQFQVLNGVVCECMPGYYLNVATCMTCSSAIVGCTTCSGSTPTCSACDSTTLYTLDTANNECDCISGYAKDSSSACQTCVSFLPNCVTCSDNSTCTQCDNLYGVDTQTASAGQCFLCSTLINNCVECTTDAACTLCQTGYAIDSSGQCQLCSFFMPNCQQCSSNSTCTACSLTTYGVDSATQQCDVCSTMINGCLQCTSDTVCTECDTANHFDFSGMLCDCVPPYYMAAGTTHCQQCSVLQPYCLLCTGAATCSICGNGGYLSGSACTICPAGCTACSSNTDCSACDTSLHFFLNDTSCLCLDGYTLQGSACVGVCGDGKVALDEPCDDGNLVDGDGCSSVCQVQTNYSCFAVPSEHSLCSYNKPLSLNLSNITKDPTSNTLTMNLKLGPVLPNLDTLDFSQMITTDANLKNPRFTLLPDGTLTATFDYDQTLDSKPINFTLNPSSVSQNFFAVPTTTLTFPLESAQNVPISHYDEEVYKNQQIYDKGYQAGVYSSYGILGLGLACDKVNGVQLFGMWQVAFLSLSNINKVQPLLQPLMELGIVNGINSHISHNTSNVPTRVASLGYQGEFLNNINYMLWILLADVVVGLGLYCIGSLVPKYQQKMQSIGLRILKEYLLMLIMFNTFNIGYSAGLQLMYGQENYVINTIVAGASILLVLGCTVCVAVCNPKEYGEFKNHYRSDPASQLYFVCSVVYRLLLGISMSQLNEVEEATIINFCISVIFMMYLITNTPYKKGYQNYRAILDNATIMVSLFIAMYYRSMKSNTDITVSSQILEPAAVSLFCLLFSTAFSFGCLCYELYLKIKSLFPSSKPVNAEKLSGEMTMNDIHVNRTAEEDLAIFVQ